MKSAILLANAKEGTFLEIAKVLSPIDYSEKAEFRVGMILEVGPYQPNGIVVTILGSEKRIQLNWLVAASISGFVSDGCLGCAGKGGLETVKGGWVDCVICDGNGFECEKVS